MNSPKQTTIGKKSRVTIGLVIVIVLVAVYIVTLASDLQHTKADQRDIKDYLASEAVSNKQFRETMIKDVSKIKERLGINE